MKSQLLTSPKRRKRKSECFHVNSISGLRIRTYCIYRKRGRLEDIAEPRVETVYFDEAPSKSFADFELDERILKVCI